MEEYKSERITGKHIWKMVTSVLNFERGLPFTFKEFLIHPHKTTHQYLFGDRRNFIDPAKFLFITITFTTFLTFKFMDATYFNEQISTYGDNEVSRTFMDFLGKYYDIFLFLNVPFLSFFSKAFFNEKDWNFTEHLAINAYYYGIVSIFSIIQLSAPSDYIIIATGISTLIVTLYMIWVYKEIFELNWGTATWKGLFVTFLSLTSYFLLMMIIGVIYAIIFLAAIG